MEFSEDGKFLKGWGGPGPATNGPLNEHGLFIDPKGNFWIASNGKGDAQVLKFNRDGKFLLQIGRFGKSAGSNDESNFASPTKAFYYAKTNEVFVSDGYINRRVAVFDADTGEYKRHWGAYGKRPDDAAPRTRTFEGPPPDQFNLPHDVLISSDDLVYVADRSNNRIQVFRPDGTFVKEAFVAREVRTPTGTVVTMAFSPDKAQQFLYVTSGDQKIRILDRQSLRVLGSIGRLWTLCRPVPSHHRHRGRFQRQPLHGRKHRPARAEVRLQRNDAAVATITTVLLKDTPQPQTLRASAAATRVTSCGPPGAC